MRAVLILCVIIGAAVACPLKKKSCAHSLPKFCPPKWNIKKFDSQYATIAFQGKWYLQLATPTYMEGQNPLKTGLFCNSFPCTDNQLEFKDTTPCDDKDYNIEFEMTDISYNLYTQTTEIQKALLSPAYGNSSPYAIFNVGSQKYYTNTIIEKNPFNDNELIRHKIGQGICEIEYTIAVIGADDCWKEYMVLAVINQYDNFFGGSPYILWVVTRDANPDWSTYDKAYKDIEKSGLSCNFLVSVDHSIESTPIPSLTVPSKTPTSPDAVNGVIEKSISSKTETKSVVSDTGRSSTITSTTTTSTVIIQKSTEFTSQYEYEPYDLCPNYQILKGLDDQTLSKAFSGKYYLHQASPCSFYNTPKSRFGLLNTAFPAGSLEIFFEDLSSNKWDYNSHHMVMERGYNMRTGEVLLTKSYISSVFPEGHPHSQSLFAIHTEGYYEQDVEEISPLSIDGMICKSPSDLYKKQIIAAIIGYKENEYLIISILNQYKNPFFTKKQVPLVYVFTREKNPSKTTLNRFTQDILRAGLNPNIFIKIDQTKPINDKFTFNKKDYELKTTNFSVTKSIVSTRGLNIEKDSPIIALPSICPKDWKVKTFKSQLATIAFQGKWNLQMTTPVYINGNNPLQTGLFCNSFPCTNNQLVFKDTTPCDDTDYNIEFEMTDISYNLYTQTTEIQKALLSPAYGNSSKYAIFNVGSQKYYTKPIIEKNPFNDNDLIRHKIGQGICEREYTIAVIGADDCWKEYMVLAVINQYDNFFGGSPYILWVVTRDVKPDWSIYDKAYKDIEKSGLSCNFLVSVDHSIESTPIPSLTVPSKTPTSPDAVNGVIEKSISSKTETKSVVSDTGRSSTITSTTTKSTVIIEKSTEFSSQYDVEPYDLFPKIKILKGLDDQTLSKAISGKYYLHQASPCSFYNTPKSRFGLLNTAFPAGSLEIFFEDLSSNKWDHNSHYMVTERGYNMRTGEVLLTKSYISSVFPEGHPHSQSLFAFYSEGYYEQDVEEISPLSIDGMICKSPSDLYKKQIITSIIGYKENEYLIISILNQYKNPFISSDDEHQVYVFTRQISPSLDTLKSITQQLLNCGFNPNHLFHIDHSYIIDEDYVFDKLSFESQTSYWSSSTSSLTTTIKSSSKSVSINCD